MADNNTEQYNEEPAATEEPHVELPSEQNETNESIQQELQHNNAKTNDATSVLNETAQESKDYEIPKDSPPDGIVSTIEINNEDRNEGVGNKEMDSVEKRPDLYDADGDGVADEQMFEGSTPSFAVYFERKRNIDGVIIAYFVFFMQMVLYLVCAAQVMGDLSGSEFVIPVNVRYGKKCTDPVNLGMNIFTDDNYRQRLHQTPSNPNMSRAIMISPPSDLIFEPEFRIIFLQQIFKYYIMTDN